VQNVDSLRSMLGNLKTAGQSFYKLNVKVASAMSFSRTTGKDSALRFLFPFRRDVPSRLPWVLEMVKKRRRTPWLNAGKRFPRRVSPFSTPSDIP
jgi:hypothetical protein